MQVFILSDDGTRTGLIERAIEPFVESSVHSGAFMLDNPESLASMMATVERSGLVIVDAVDGVTLIRAWIAGTCFALGLPMVVLWDNGRVMDFQPFIHSVTVVISVPSLALAVNLISQGIIDGQEAYVEAATALHTEFLERMSE